MSDAGKTLQRALFGRVVRLTYAATMTINAIEGNVFEIVASGNGNLAAPTNPTNGQCITILHYALASDRLLNLETGAGAFDLGTFIPSITTTTAGTIDFIGLRYTTLQSHNRWDVVAYDKGH